MSDFGSTTPIQLERSDGKGLAAGTLGLWGSTVIGLASTAPVYSLVATLGWVVLAVGGQAHVGHLSIRGTSGARSARHSGRSARGRDR